MAIPTAEAPRRRSQQSKKSAAAGLRQRGQAAARPEPINKVPGPESEGVLAAPGRVGPRSRVAPLYGLAKTLHRRFGNIRLDQRYELVIDRHGDIVVHRIIQPTDLPKVSLPDAPAARAALESCLEVVHGIGPATERTLRAIGLTSVRHLTQLARHRQHAAEVVAEHDAGDLAAICRRLTRRLGEQGHLLTTLSCSLVAPEDIVFFDLETMGLWNNVVFLAGFGRIRESSFVVEQYLAPGYANERAVIAFALERLSTAKVVVTFNGRTADLPWIRGRAFYFNLGPCPDPLHVDLMYGARRRYVRLERRLDSVQLPIVTEHVLGLPRPAHDIDGFLIPQIYSAYAEDPDARQGLLVPILDHNRSDLEALVVLLERLSAGALAAR